MKTTEELKEMELGDLMDCLIEAEDYIKYCNHSMRDVEYLHSLKHEFKRRQQII